MVDVNEKNVCALRSKKKRGLEAYSAERYNDTSQYEISEDVISYDPAPVTIATWFEPLRFYFNLIFGNKGRTLF